MKPRKFIGFGTIASDGTLLPVKDLFGSKLQAYMVWKVYGFYATQNDLGWYDMPDKNMERLAIYLDEVIDLCAKTLTTTRNKERRKIWIPTREYMGVVRSQGSNRGVKLIWPQLTSFCS